MSDIHALPLRGRDMPEIDYASDLRKSPYLVQPPAKARRKARVWWGPDGWRWEHACHPMKWTDSGCPWDGSSPSGSRTSDPRLIRVAI